MFGAAPIERSTLTAAQKSKSPLNFCWLCPIIPRQASCELLDILLGQKFSFYVATLQNEDWKQMFGAAPIERSTLTAAQKSKSPSPAGSGVSAARSEKELSQLVTSMEHLALTRSGSAGQLGMSSTATLSSGGGSVFSTTVIRPMRQPMENTHRGDLMPSLSYSYSSQPSCPHGIVE